MPIGLSRGHFLLYKRLLPPPKNVLLYPPPSYPLHIFPPCVQPKVLNPLESIGNYSATSNNIKLVHWPLMDGLLYLVQLGGAWAGWGPAQSPHRCTKCNTHPSTASVPITVLLYNGPLLCGFNVAIKG